jgi:hypothetical protein
LSLSGIWLASLYAFSLHEECHRYIDELRNRC